MFVKLVRIGKDAELKQQFGQVFSVAVCCLATSAMVKINKASG